LAHGKQHIKTQRGIKELELMKACKHLGVEESHNIKHKNEKEELKMEYVKRLSSLWTHTTKCKKIKCKQLEHWLHQY
jgi:tRNA A-37 threonylcarbamoyl transferase component Bud32